jgi:hypothetical protein
LDIYSPPEKRPTKRIGEEEAGKRNPKNPYSFFALILVSSSFP